ncbi:L-alanine-DL-glutamate epimerase (EC 5.1.1.n1) [hydrothermal vent metagenome]|uniref:L-alanine-DL-glutamate epimerase n=1 Tax=hydrothermal vent metagenome TaxID=652676 RepID=A0A3B1AK34_9ZZZZ
MLNITKETWTLKEPFIIARGSRIATEVITVDLRFDNQKHSGRGESVPSPRYGENIDSVYQQLKTAGPELHNGLRRGDLYDILPPGAARNALDCALWDLEAKGKNTSVSEILGLPYPDNIQTVQTISIGTAEEMGKAAKKLNKFPMLKIKLNDQDIVKRIEAIQANAPQSRLLIDANESWCFDLLKDVAPALAKLNVVMIEQPLPAANDEELSGYQSPIPLGADESCHTSDDVKKLCGLYDIVNIKLDKTGGLTEAVKLAAKARKAKLGIMVGCMVGTSLSMAPAMVLAPQAAYVDLDAPALLSKDREYGLIINNGQMSRLDERLWGG